MRGDEVTKNIFKLLQQANGILTYHKCYELLGAYIFSWLRVCTYKILVFHNYDMNLPENIINYSLC
jgi:hypothetical protein